MSLSKLDRILEANETILWRGKPFKQAFVLPAFGGIPFGLVFLAFFFMWAAGLPLMQDLQAFLAVLLAVFGFGIIVVPPILQFKKYQNTEYMVTNKRLLIQSGVLNRDAWFAYFGEIKEVGVKVGLVDKLFETGTVYPITPYYPFPRGTRFWYTHGGMGRVRKIFNPATCKDEEYSELQLFQMTNGRPCLSGLKEPGKVRQLLSVALERSEID